ncbi:nitroreductase family protein [Parvularcula maris]|uniref:Nitroreductase family protein n=1 Tax=Parvularcula maris TaxID=2965077 RepID=A0A9X2RJN8_9PROT|nr:nitroreductase family protein [Parvularcula maris]MCQ8184877.1 nitroreductase family protein [Parvularcula maris]
MAMSVSEAVTRRRSTRAFTDETVSEERLRALLDKALRSPSGGNLQPWRIIAVTGEEREALSGPAAASLMANPTGDDEGYPIYPKNLADPYRSRRFAVGESLYAALGIPREDKMARMAWLASNFSFFGAPLGLFFVTRKSFGHHQWAHMGMLMQTIALLAEEEGLGTCMQEAWALVRPQLRERFGLEDDEIVYAGMALGVPDRKAPVNGWRSERADTSELLELRGF